MLRHIGFIMDGNRRWATRLSNLISIGHEKGGDNIEPILSLCLDARIEYASFWALSKENILERSEIEIMGIYQLLRNKIPGLVTKLIKNDISLEIAGDLSLVPSDIRSLLLDAVEMTRDSTKMKFILAIAYSGQDEIVRGVKRAIAEGVDPSSLDESTFVTYLDTGRYPPPDLIVRTGGAIRHSGFFLYHSAYSEYYFTPTLWPDFGKTDFDKAIESYNDTNRNYGK